MPSLTGWMSDEQFDKEHGGSTIATDEGVVIAEQRHVLTTTFTGPECDGQECDDIQHRAGCALFNEEA